MTYTVVCLELGPDRVPGRDAWRCYLRVDTIDGDYFQFVTPILTGQTISIPDVEGVPRRDLWAATALEAVPLIEDAIRLGEIPLPDPKTAFEVLPPERAVLARAKRDHPAIADGDTIATIEI